MATFRVSVSMDTRIFGDVFVEADSRDDALKKCTREVISEKFETANGWDEDLWYSSNIYISMVWNCDTQDEWDTNVYLTDDHATSGYHSIRTDWLVAAYDHVKHLKNNSENGSLQAFIECCEDLIAGAARSKMSKSA